ncbi:MAG: sulfate permease [Acidimicrobiales bacterium]
MSAASPPPTGRTLQRRLPGLYRLLHYDRDWLRFDLLGGLTVGAMLIPQSMAYAELADLPPEVGFYAVLGALVVYALLGSSRHLGVGPEPGTAILAATGIAPLAEGDPQRYLTLMAALALLVGGICLVAALLRLGFLADLLSRPVLIGYITGVGITLLSSQLGKVTGVGIEGDNAFTRFADLVSGLDQLDPATFAMGASSLVAILTLRAIRPTIPGALVAVVAATAAAIVFGLDDHGVSVVGEIPSGLPPLGLPDVAGADLVDLIPIALGVALVGYSDNVLTARSIGAELGYRIDANQELVALGMGNLSSGLSGGFPISSSASRSIVPASLGTRSQLVSIVAAGFVLTTLLVLRPVLADFPEAALGAVIISAAIAIIDIRGLRELWSLDRAEFGLALLTVLGVVGFDVLRGVLVAVGLSAVVALGRMARPRDAVLGGAPELDGWVAMEEFPSARPRPGLLVYRFDAPLFFANAEWFRGRVEQALLTNPGAERWVIFDLEGVGSIDTTALEILDQLVEELLAAGVVVVGIARANSRARAALENSRLLQPGGPLREFPTINSAVSAFSDEDEP